VKRAGGRYSRVDGKPWERGEKRWGVKRLKGSTYPRKQVDNSQETKKKIGKGHCITLNKLKNCRKKHGKL